MHNYTAYETSRQGQEEMEKASFLDLEMALTPCLVKLVDKLKTDKLKMFIFDFKNFPLNG